MKTKTKFYCTALLTVAAAPSQAKEVAPQPNILMIVCEDISPYLGC